MGHSLNEAYKKIFGADPLPDMQSWQIAEKIIDNFSFPKLGEELAGEVIFEVVLDTEYPNQEITNRIVGRAENFAKELWDDLPDEVHMADLERKRFLMRESGSGEQEKELISRR